MGNTHAKQSIMRSSSMMKPSNQDTKKSKGVSKSMTTGFINETLHQPDDNFSYEEEPGEHSPAASDYNKRHSCFNFSACHPDSQYKHSKSDLKQNLIYQNCPDASTNPRVNLRSQSHNRILNSHGIISKVRQRFGNMHRRSTPPNFDNNIQESFEAPALTLTNPVVRSMTDYDMVKLDSADSGETTGLIQEESHLLKKRKFGYAKLNKFTKSPALYDIHLYANEDPYLESKKISDLLEEKENDYDEYEKDYDYENENTYENNSPVKQLDLDLANNFTYQTNKFNRFKPSQSMGSSGSYTVSDNSYENHDTNNKTACPLNHSDSEALPNHQPSQFNTETESIIFIDDGQSEYCVSNSSRSSSMPSLMVSSYKCSVNNLSRLMLQQREVPTNQAYRNNNNTNEFFRASSKLVRSQKPEEESEKLQHDSIAQSESNQFLNEVNRKLIKFAKNNTKVSWDKYRPKLQHSATVDISRNYDEQFNDNISIFHHVSRKAPLASSETTTLSNSNDNLLGSSIPSYRLFNPKYPLVSQLLMNAQQEYFNDNTNDNNYL